MGAIMVLFLFVLMLLNLNEDSEPLKPLFAKLAGIIAGMCLLVTLMGSFKAAGSIMSVNGSNHQEVVQNLDLGTVKYLGKVLFTEFLLPFEVSSILLLSAMVGAVLLAKRETREIL